MVWVRENGIWVVTWSLIIIGLVGTHSRQVKAVMPDSMGNAPFLLSRVM